jgi:predicted site-specific integrase-resolvase
MYVNPKKATEYYKVSEQCLRIWANQGKIKYILTKGGHRRYLIPSGEKEEKIVTTKVVYARVSSRKQKGDLENQIEYLRQKNPNHKIISDTGSGINFERPGFKRILDGVFKGTIEEVVVTQRDRFTRFGYELFEWIFQEHNARLICIDSTEPKGENEELSEDLMAIITVFSSRYYGKRRYRTNPKTGL